MGESPDCLLLFGTVVGENPDYVCWEVKHVIVRGRVETTAEIGRLQDTADFFFNFTD